MDMPRNARSFLFVPGDRPDRFDKAAACGADMVILDLEDAVQPQARNEARAAIARWLKGGGQAAIRVNAVGTPWHEEDAALLHSPGVLAAMLPKAEQPHTLAAFCAALPAGLPAIPLVESALGIWNVRELAAVPSVCRLAFGSVDFQLDCGAEDGSDVLAHARSLLVLASKIEGVAPPVDGVTVRLGDDARLAADVASGRASGFGGKLCIHPRQVAAVNAGFGPDTETLARARAIVKAAEENDAAGAFQFEGELIDRPVIERAMRTIRNSQ